jgi:UDP-N-acetylmuramyl pentapeptide phosphotransferase/UDP-N-acetylglucosamine-1-phosphate transferase
MTLLPALIAFGLTWLAIRLLIAYAAHLPLDRPNARSLHANAVPRTGGLAVLAAWLVVTVWLPGDKPWVAPLLALAAVSLIDDRRGVHPALRLAVHFGAAAAWVWLSPPPMDALLAVMLIVWMTNLYNFMDGSDGLAAAMAVTGFGTYAAGAWVAGSPVAGVLAALAAASAAFLLHNAPPARIFLGDVGSVPLGFLAAAFGLLGWTQGWWPAWFPVLVFLPFIADASITLALRLARGVRVWEAHRDHGYQHLVQLGWGHGRTLALYTVLMLGCAASAWAALVWAPALGVVALVLWTAVLASVYAVIGYHWRRRGAGFEESKG